MEENKIDEVKALQEKVNKFLEMEKVVDLLTKNVVEFEHDGIKYRIRKPTYKQKMEVNEKRIYKYTDQLKNTSLLMEKDLIEIYKKRGIDIPALDSKILTLDKTRKALMLKLGEGLKQLLPDTELKTLKDEIQSILKEQQELTLQKILYLDSSVESQVNIYVFTYLGFLLTERQDGGNWVRGWIDYEEFMNQPDSLINTITFYVTFVSQAELP
jgi:hypothetical protein